MLIAAPVFYAAAIPAVLLTGNSKGGFGSALGGGALLEDGSYTVSFVRMVAGKLPCRLATQQHARGRSVIRGTFWSDVSGLTSFLAYAGAPPAMVYMLPRRMDKVRPVTRMPLSRTNLCAASSPSG